MSNRPEYLLSVVVSCSNQTEILKKNLQALARQSLSRSIWQALFIFQEELKDSPSISLIKNKFLKAEILFLPSKSPIYEMRNLGLKQAGSPIIYFIDEDVILKDEEALSRVLKLHKKQPHVTAIGAGYYDHPESSLWGLSYNYVVRVWMKAWPEFMPGGNLSVKTDKAFKALFKSSHHLGFGGEEIHFLKSLMAEGHKTLQDDSLSAYHIARHSFFKFIRRAWLHGANLAFEGKPRFAPRLFIKCHGKALIKIFAVFYLLLVRGSFFLNKLKKR